MNLVLPKLASNDSALTQKVLFIQRPDNPKHYMTIGASEQKISVRRGGEIILNCRDVVIVREVFEKTFEPVAYFSRRCFNSDDLRFSTKTTLCPLKGRARYYDLRVNGLWKAKLLWSYEELYDFDKGLASLSGRLAFDLNIVSISIGK